VAEEGHQASVEVGVLLPTEMEEEAAVEVLKTTTDMKAEEHMEEALE
jgi:hypothetical protein